MPLKVYMNYLYVCLQNIFKTNLFEFLLFLKLKKKSNFATQKSPFKKLYSVGFN